MPPHYQVSKHLPISIWRDIATKRKKMTKKWSFRRRQPQFWKTQFTKQQKARFARFSGLAGCKRRTFFRIWQNSVKNKTVSRRLSLAYTRAHSTGFHFFAVTSVTAITSPPPFFLQSRWFTTSKTTRRLKKNKPSLFQNDLSLLIKQPVTFHKITRRLK